MAGVVGNSFSVMPERNIYKNTTYTMILPYCQSHLCRHLSCTPRSERIEVKPGKFEVRPLPVMDNDWICNAESKRILDITECWREIEKRNPPVSTINVPIPKSPKKKSPTHKKPKKPRTVFSPKLKKKKLTPKKQKKPKTKSKSKKKPQQPKPKTKGIKPPVQVTLFSYINRTKG